MQNYLSCYADCRLCPRSCGADRFKAAGFCRQSSKIKIARAALHRWEEPCISGKNGSGAVFFSGCPLRCCYCQNYEISQQNKGYYVTEDELADIFLRLCFEGAHNINLVSPTPFVPSIIKALDIAKKERNFTVIYNSSGFESVETIKMLKGYVDVYLPDMKYFSDEYAKKYSGCENYHETAIRAIAEMQKQVGKPVFTDDGLIVKGVIVRHLAIPTLRHDSMKVISSLADVFKPDEIVLSLMSQYMPVYKACEHSEINRKISTFEYNSIVDFAASLGFSGYSQDKASSDEAYVPEFFDKKDDAFGKSGE